MKNQSYSSNPERSIPVEALECHTSLVDLKTLSKVQLEMISTQKAQRMAEFFSTLADPNRLRLLSALAQQELCVCDLAAMAKMSESAVSHQLRVLRSQNLVKYRRKGRNICYRLADRHVVDLYEAVDAHLEEL